MGSSIVRVSTGRRVVTALFVPIFLATLFASTLTATAPGAAVAASPGRAPVISADLRAEFKGRESVQAVVTAHDRAGLAAIKRLGIRGTQLKVLPMLLVPRLTQGQLAMLERLPQVRSVYDNDKHPIQMEDTTWITGARYVWGPPHAPEFMGDGFEGEGVEIAVIDTGVDGKHEDLDNLIEYCETSGAVTNDSAQVLCSPIDPNPDNATPDTCDSGAPAGPANNARLDSTDDPPGGGHGSHVSGTIAGTGDASGGQGDTHSTMGLAPKAKLRVYSANIAIALASFQILSAYDDMTCKKLAGLNNVVATSNSFGGGDGANYDPADPDNIAVKEAYDAGILSVFAAGNSGPEHDTLSAQCVNPYVVCVAASTKPDSVVMFSSRGRPSEPADTNRNGIVGDEGDVKPDNHDRKLGQKLGIGLYRPTITAPGVNIYSVDAQLGESPPDCPEEFAPTPQMDDEDIGQCYVAFNGTSMATPHVSGAVALIVQAWRSEHGGNTPSPAKITDILERSANITKLPGYESEEQGAGRLNVFDAVKYALGKITLPKPNMGTPSPIYDTNKYPGHASTKTEFDGCTLPLSYTAGRLNPVDDPDEPPEADTGRFKQHIINVPAKAERLRITVEWPEHETANLYLRLWRPGVDPDDEFAPAGPDRVFPDQESIGLLEVTTSRFLDVRAPEEGAWKLRVYHRVGGAPAPCESPAPVVTPPETTGYNYHVTAEIPISKYVPTVTITSPAAGSPAFTGRWITFRGTAAYPARWDGVTNYEVPGTPPEAPPSEEPPEETRTTLHMQGNPPEDTGCTGDGAGDIIACDGPFLSEGATLSSNPVAASWKVPNPLLDGTSDRTIYDPNWIWNLSSPTTVSGRMTVNWWAQCAACTSGVGISADWFIRLWADGRLKAEKRVTATPAQPDFAELLTADVDLPEIRAEQNFVLHIDPVYIDSQNLTTIYYDSQDPCPTALSSAACDSTVLMPVGAGTGGGGGGFGPPDNLRVTDVHTGLRVAWDPADGAASYEVHRSTQPDFVPSTANRIAGGTFEGCTSPNVPSWPSASDTGALCYTDSSVTNLTTYYYRVVSVGSGATRSASQLSYGTPTLYDRQVKLKVDRLFGPGYWDYSNFTNRTTAAMTSWVYRWDTFERDPAPTSHTVFARSFTQGIGSAKVSRIVDTEGEAPPEARDPVVALTKTGPRTTTQGSTITYRISYENLGPEAASTAKVIDLLPSSVTFVSATGGGTYSSTTNKVTWQLGTVSVGETGSVTLKVKVRGPKAVSDGTLITNTAEFKAPLTVATPGVWFTLVE